MTLRYLSDGPWRGVLTKHRRDVARYTTGCGRGFDARWLYGCMSGGLAVTCECSELINSRLKHDHALVKTVLDDSGQTGMGYAIIHSGDESNRERMTPVIVLHRADQDDSLLSGQQMYRPQERRRPKTPGGCGEAAKAPIIMRSVPNSVFAEAVQAEVAAFP